MSLLSHWVCSYSPASPLFLKRSLYIHCCLKLRLEMPSHHKLLFNPQTLPLIKSASRTFYKVRISKELCVQDSYKTNVVIWLLINPLFESTIWCPGLHWVDPFVNSNIFTSEQRETMACGGLLSPFYKILQDFISLVEPSESDASQTIVHQAPILLHPPYFPELRLESSVLASTIESSQH